MFVPHQLGHLAVQGEQFGGTRDAVRTHFWHETAVVLV
jgi:hypothetical protein